MKRVAKVVITVLLLLLLSGCDLESEYEYHEEQQEESVEENYAIDFEDAESFEQALNDGQDVKGKIVCFDVNAYKPNSVLGINCWSGEHLNFISENELEVEEGDCIVGRVTEKPKKTMIDSWKIYYEVLEIIPKDNQEKVENISNKKDMESSFEKGTYKVENVKNFSFAIPNYWKEEGSKNEYLQYYAKKGEKVVMLSISYPKETDKNYDVSFEGLYDDNENMIDAIGGMFTDGDVIDYEIFESDYGVKGILYHFTYSQKIDWLTKEKGSGYCFCFPSEKDRRWFFVTLLYTNNVASDEYREDYMKIISEIKEKQ